jgi:DNA topoisomerase-1
MERTNIRVGNCSYEKANGSYGITTLKDKHVKVNGTSIKFAFKGKKGVYHELGIKNKKLAAIVKKCQDIPGKELFQYIDQDGQRRTIDSGMVNEYIKEITNGDFTAKDLRTWSGSVQALLAFKNLGLSETQTQTKRNIVSALDHVSKELGNTRTVCKKYYVHPLIISLYESKTIQKYLKDLDETEEENKSCAHQRRAGINEHFKIKLKNMQVSDYTLLSKGAAVNGPVKKENPDQFTYILADEKRNILHVYSSEENEKWINSRDTGTSLNADPSTIAKLLKRSKKRSA